MSYIFLSLLCFLLVASALSFKLPVSCSPRRTRTVLFGQPAGGQHLIDAGLLLQEAADCMGPSHFAGPHLFKDAGLSLVDVGDSWSKSWEAVTYAADEAAEMFYELSQVPQRPELQKLYSASSSEFKEIASISGCSSIGPPTAVPNLEALSLNFKKTASFVEDAHVYQDGKEFARALRKASRSLMALAKEY